MLLLSLAVQPLEFIANPQIFTQTLVTLLLTVGAKKLCCLIHGEAEVFRYISSFSAKIIQNKYEGRDRQPEIRISTMLGNGRFSDSFADFLCNCLQFNHR